MTTRLEKLVSRADVYVDYPEDVARLKAAIPELRELADGMVHFLYAEWSEEQYSASWLIMNSDYVAEFARWLKNEVP